MPCMYFNSPQGCPKTEDECLYKHRKATEEEKKKFPKPRSPSPAGKRTPCATFMKTGTCAYGDQCRRSHDPADFPANKRG